MKILILTPLFPPDVGDPAHYVKELCTRLAHNGPTLLMYGYLPEAVDGVTMITVDKRQPLWKRLFSYSIALFKVSKDTDCIFINNAPSTELPALIISFFRKRKMILCESDSLAITAAESGLYKIVNYLLKKRCKKIITLPSESVYKKPEILPFSTIEENVIKSHEDWWDAHVKQI